MTHSCDLRTDMKKGRPINTIASRLLLVLGLTALFGAPMQGATWYFEDTVLQGTFSGFATVSGYVTIAGANFGFPDDITLTGPFGELIDPGAGLQLDEGSSGYADDYVDFGLQQSLLTAGLTTDPLVFFTFTSAGFSVVDTYSLVTGVLTNVEPTPEPGTGMMVIGALGLVGGVVWRRRVRTNESCRIE